ncbi:hypothetical protein BAE44_0025076, partial [Dichanthelium oligosanthes]
LKPRPCSLTRKKEQGFSVSSLLAQGTEEEEGDGSGKSQSPDSTQPSQKKRPIGRKQAKDMLKTGVDAGPYKEAIEELILEKKEVKKLKEERWEEERWKETKMIHQQKISWEKEKFMLEQEQKIMFCDVSTLDQDQKSYVLVAAQKMAAFNCWFGDGFDGGFGASSGGSGGDDDGAAQQIEFSHWEVMRRMRLFFASKIEQPALFEEYSAENPPQGVVVSQPVDPILPGPASMTAAAGEVVMDDATAATTAPEPNPVVTASGDESTTITEGAAAMGEDTTILPLSSEVVTTPQMEEVVDEDIVGGRSRTRDNPRWAALRCFREYFFCAVIATTDVGGNGESYNASGPPTQLHGCTGQAAPSPRAYMGNLHPLAHEGDHHARMEQTLWEELAAAHEQLHQ